MLQMLLGARRRKLQRRFGMWQRNANLIAKTEYEQQLRDAHEKQRMIVRAMHNSSKARGNVRCVAELISHGRRSFAILFCFACLCDSDADINTSVSLERQPAAEQTPPAKSKWDALFAHLLENRQRESSVRSLAAQVLFSDCSADDLLQEIELRIQGNLARVRSQQPVSALVACLVVCSVGSTFVLHNAFAVQLPLVLLFSSLLTGSCSRCGKN